MFDCFLVGIGGFIGTVCRYLIGMLPVKQDSVFPIKTLIINVAGAFIIGLITGLAVKYKAFDSRLVLLLKVGVCGGFTTFSTFAFETADLVQRGNTGSAFVYALLSMVLGVLAVFVSQMLVQSM